jgi:DNA-binding PadR family transcriptional regulator
MAESEISRTDLMLLGMLDERAMHGYEIAEVLGSPGTGSWMGVGKTSIYYALSRLDRNGLVSKHTERPGGKPERTVYSITDAGRGAFYDGLESSIRTPRACIGNFDVALYFADHLKKGVAREAFAERLAGLGSMEVRIRSLIEESRSTGLDSQAAVLEHRLRLIDANKAYLRDLLETPPSLSGSYAGELESTLVPEVLRSLAAGRRSGTLFVRPGAGEVQLGLEDGELRGVSCEPGETAQAALRRAMTASVGRFEFRSGTPDAACLLPVAGLAQSIIEGSRGVDDPQLRDRMLPSPDVPLELSAPARLSMVGCELTDDESAVIAALDGVRTVADVGAALGWPASRVGTVVFPLWAVGWVVRTDGEKRRLAQAINWYVTRWMKAVELFIGVPAAGALVEEVRQAAAHGDIEDFSAMDRTPGGMRLPGSTEALAGRAGQFVAMLTRAVQVRLGDTFVDEVRTGYAADLPEEYGSVMEKFKVTTGVEQR